MDDEVSQSLASIQEATERLQASAGELTDGQLREPSALPGWTRGHVLSHVARNADGLVNLLRWARTGARTPMYASREARDADIEAGSGRSAADLTADVRDSAAAFAAEAASLPEAAWQVPVEVLTTEFPAYGVLQRRLSEVEIHHVDLAAGYRPADWPDDFVTASLPRVARSFAGREDAPACLVQPAGLGPWAGKGEWFRIGPDQPDQVPIAVSGPAAEVLGWLLGRCDGSGLRVDRADAPPVLPPWR